MILKCNADFYYPKNKGLDLFIKLNKLDKYSLFNNDEYILKDKLKQFGVLVIQVLGQKNDDELEEEATDFFHYLLLPTIRRDIDVYLQSILKYFKSIGYLRFKKNTYNDMKQSIKRYRICYYSKKKDIIIQKDYSSLKQVSNDIGSGKTTSIYYKLKNL